MSDNILNIKNLFSDSLAGSANAESRKKSFGQFESLGLPTRQNEEWKYTSLRSLQKVWQLSVVDNVPKTLVQEDCVRIFSRNGFFDLQEAGEALKKLDIQVEDASSLPEKSASSSRKPFWHLGHAFLNNGLLLKISKKSQTNLPIVIEHQIDGQNLFVHPYVAVQVESDASVSIFERFNFENNNIWINSISTAVVGAGGFLNFYKIYSEGAESSHIDNNYFEQQASSNLRFVNVGSGGQLLRNDTHVEILGENVTCDLRGLSILKNKNQMDHSVHVHHTKSQSMSRQIFKSILSDESHYVFQGNVIIDAIAQKTDASQLNKNLMLGKKCRVDTKPRLDVYADDVKATHGSATGQMDHDQKFYLESRGINSELASALICQGFALDILADLPKNYSKEELQKFIAQILQIRGSHV